MRSEDFRGLRHLADRLGDDLIVGLVLYTGTETLPFGPRFPGDADQRVVGGNTVDRRNIRILELVDLP